MCYNVDDRKVNSLEMQGNRTYKAQMFNRGQSAKVFREVVDEDLPGCVIRNSEPYVAILKYESYLKLLRKAQKYDEIGGEI